MRSMKLIGQILFLMLGVVISLQAVPPVLNYAGQVAVNGQPFEGEGLFKFASLIQMERLLIGVMTEKV